MDWEKIEYETQTGDGERYFFLATNYFYSETKPTNTGNYWHYVDGVATKWS